MNSPIEYDRGGKPLGGGLNLVTNSVTCSACGESWTETRTDLECAQGKPAKWRPEPNARGKRRRPQRLEKRKRLTGVRLTELLGGGAHTLAAPPNEATHAPRA